MVICETKQQNNEATAVPNSLGISNKVLLVVVIGQEKRHAVAR